MLLEVRAQDASPVRAASIADAAARQTINVIKAVERPPYVVVSPVQPVLTELASVPSRPISPRTLLNIGCGAIIGLLLGLTYVAAWSAREKAGGWLDFEATLLPLNSGGCSAYSWPRTTCLLARSTTTPGCCA